MAMPNSTQAQFSVSIINNQHFRNGCVQARNALINFICLGNAITVYQLYINLQVEAGHLAFNIASRS